MITIAGVPLSFAAVGPIAEAIGADATLILAGLVGGAVDPALHAAAGRPGPGARRSPGGSPTPVAEESPNVAGPGVDSSPWSTPTSAGSASSSARLCLGTMNFGPHASEEESHSIMDAAIAHGINFFDTANVYGRHLGVGATEEIIGRWVAKGSGRRDKVVLATKVYGTMGDWPNESRLSKLSIVSSARSRCGACGTDRIDLYQMHHIDRNAWWDEIWEAMEQLKRTGKILYVGSSNFAGWHIARANEIAGYRHSFGLATEQSLYNLTARTIELEVIPALVEYGMGLIPWSPLSGGLLAGALSKVERRSPRHRVHAGRDRGEPLEARAMGGPVRRARRATPPTWPSHGCCTSRR